MRMRGVLRAVVVVAAGGGMVYGGTAAQGQLWLTRTSDTHQTSVATSAGRSQTVCPGPDRPGSPGVGYDGQTVQVLTALAPSTLLSAGSPGKGGSVTSVRMPSSSGGAVDVAAQPGGSAVASVRGGGAVQVVGTSERAAGLIAMQSSRDDTKTARGIQLLQCAAPQRDAWLLAGSGQAGRLARLVLSNAGDGPVSVDAQVFGASGLLEHKSLHDIVVPAGGRKVVVVGALGAAGAHTAIHVTAHGGLVQAAVMDRWMTGETRSGEELTSASAEPSKSQVLPAVTDVGAEPGVRVMVPGHQEAIVRVRVTDTHGAVVDDQVLTVQAGRAGGVSLKGLKKGNYSVHVTADEPVVASAMSRTASSGTSDFAWMPAAPEITTLTGFALPTPAKQTSDTLVLSAPGKGATVRLTTQSASGEPATRTVKVPADRPVAVPVTDARTGWIDVVHGGVYAGLVSTAADSSGPLVTAAVLHPVRTSARAVRATPAGD